MVILCDSGFVTMNVDNYELYSVTRALCCKVSKFPIKYLEIPLHNGKLRKEDLQPVVDEVIKRAAGWRGELLSLAGRLILVKTCLASTPTYLLSAIKFPKWTIEAINS